MESEVGDLATFAELDMVQLRFDTADGETLLRGGTVGTIVYCHASGAAYEVEFAEPVGTVLTLEPLDIVPLPNAA